MDAPEVKVDGARDRFCPPYKPALWAPFLAEVLGRGAAARLLATDAAAEPPASPVRAMRPLSPSPASPRGGASRRRASSARGVRGAGEHAPTSLDYVAATAVGLGSPAEGLGGGACTVRATAAAVGPGVIRGTRGGGIALGSGKR